MDKKTGISRLNISFSLDLGCTELGAKKGEHAIFFDFHCDADRAMGVVQGF